MHLIISLLPHFGHENLAVPMVLVILFLHEIHTSFASAMKAWD